MPVDLDEVKTWCDGARTILKKKKAKKPEKQLGGRASKVISEIKALRKSVGKGNGVITPEQLDEYENQFASIATAIRAAAGTDDKEVERQSNQLSELKKQLAVHLAGGKSSKGKAEEKLKTSHEGNKEAKEYIDVRDPILVKRNSLAAEIKDGDLKGRLDEIDKKIAAAKADADKGLYGEAVKKLKAVDTECGLLKTDVDLNAKKEYEEAYKLIEPNYKGALKVYFLNAARLAVQYKPFLDAYSPWNKAVKAEAWVTAKGTLDALDKASLALKAAGDSLLVEKKEFDKAFKKVSDGDLKKAQDIARAKPLTLMPTSVKDFHKAYEALNDARNNGEFAEGKDAIPALKAAVKGLIAANKKVESQKQEFIDAMAQVTDYALAKELAAAKSPAVKDKIGAFNSADKAVAEQKGKEEWTKATKLVGALKSAATDLLAAKTDHNSKLSFEQKTGFQLKIAALKNRTALAAAGGDSEFIEKLKTTVREQLKAVNDLMLANDYAAAELGHTKLLADLVKMETALEDYRDYFAKFTKAKNGPVAQALAVKLTPENKLGKERTDALKETEERIEQWAKKKGKIKDKAEPMVDEWIEEAEAWKTAQTASDNLNKGDAPNEGVLKALADKKGGGKVLDALMKGLPDGKPEKFLREALKIRFGINVTQFEKRNKELQDYAGLKKVSDNAPDKQLKNMYLVFGKVPLGNVKGKVKDLIQFEEDAGGAAALQSSGKIWMYCGRPDDPNASKQKFSVAGEIVPKGEKVDEEFQPVDDTPLPYFDFAAMHEVGHIVDPKDKNALAGWQEETVENVAKEVVARFQYTNSDKFVIDTLTDKKATPPGPVGVDEDVWKKRTEEVVNWCQSVRVGMSLWNDAALSKFVAIKGRVYQEAYDGRWVSYDYAARSKGISGYQFRAPSEWFAELYAAYFSKKLKKNHPYAAWLKPLKKTA